MQICNVMMMIMKLNSEQLYKKFSCLQFTEIFDENQINLFNPYGSYLLYLLSFYLTGEKWHGFSIFCCNPNNYKKFLKAEDLCITKQDDKSRLMMVVILFF